MNRPLVPAVSRHFHRLAWFAALLVFGVIVFGAFVRLSNAGLSCPDWPTCYGRAAWPTRAGEVANHAASAIRALDPHRAWREQLHRHLAGTLGMLVFALALLAVRRRRFGMPLVVIAAGCVGLAIPLYMHGLHQASGACALLAQALLLGAAWRWNNEDFSRVALLTFAVIIIQALLGMWTVTWLLRPIVVMGHLLGGFTTFALLAWMGWRATDRPIALAEFATVRLWLLVGLGLLALQIALGGWVSSNYAALSCGAGNWSLENFPKCAGQWWPQADYAQGFVLWRGVGVNYEGGVLDGRARIAIQLVHRLMAGVVFLYLWAFAVRLMRTPGLRGWGASIAALVSLQVGLGIANIKLALPLPVAVAHNAGAALLLFLLVSLLARLEPPE